MNDSEKASFVTAIGAMLETFGQEATKPILHGYWLGLNDLGLPELQRAIAVAIRSSERVPKPVELRRLAGEKTDEQRAVGAWDDVLQALPIGPWKHVNFRDRLINAVIRNLGGWPNFCARFSNGEGEKWARIEFLKTYSAIAQGRVSDEAMAALPGLSQQTCIGGKCVDPSPVAIGCSSPDRPRIEPAKHERPAVPSGFLKHASTE